MTESDNALYEGMFLFNNTMIGGELSQAVDHLTEILNRAGAEVEAIMKWDDRRLAYPIKGQKRGLYLLTYFRVPGVQIANIERDVNLSELLLRCLILRADHVGETELQLAKDKASQTRDAMGVEGQEASSEGEAPAPAAPAAPAAPTAPAETEAAPAAEGATEETKDDAPDAESNDTTPAQA